MKGRLLFLLAAALFLAPRIARADGCFIPPTAFAKVQIPDQRALIHYADGTETLVIDTSFKGDGTNFAWIIPIPSVPKVEAATTGLFPTLQELFEPEVIHYVPRYYWAVLVGAVFICSFAWGKRHGHSTLEVAVFWTCILVLAGLLLPSLATAGVSAARAAGLQVLSSKTVGVYDTVTLSSTNGRAVFDWLQTNGFATPTNLAPAIESYAREGWVFVASKLRMDASLDGPTRAHPLSLTFKTQRAVYPLRLTGIGNGKCKIDLYVFGPDRAESPNFSVERCTLPSYPKLYDDFRMFGGHDSVRILHPLLRQIVDHSPVATKLTAELTSEKMASDAYINWSPFQEKRLTYYSSHGASVSALNVAGSLFIAGLAISYCFRWSAGWLGRLLVKAGICLVFAAVPAWLVIYLPLPKIPVAVATWPEMRMANMHQLYVPAMINDRLNDAKATNKVNLTPDLNWVRRELQENSTLRENLGSKRQTNLFTGQPWHEEDSPGNFTLRQGNGGVEYVWYDIDGGAHVIPLFQPESR